MAPSSSPDFLDRALARLETLYRQQHLDPGRLRKLGIKPQWNVVMGTGGQSGLAMNFTGEHSVYGEEEALPQVDDLRPYLGKSLFDLAAYLVKSPDLHRRALCLAALNALSQPLTAPEALVARGFRVTVAEMEAFVRPDEIVTVIGHGGVVRQFMGRCRELHVTDMRPVSTFQTLLLDETGIRQGPTQLFVHPAEDNAELLARSDVVIITACTLVNGTFDQTLAMVKKARVVGLYGPSAQLPPEVYFPEGINFVRSFRATDPTRFEYDMENDMDMEVALKGNQQTYHIYGFGGAS